jgi:surfactin synthase thioesterase subunit
VCLPHAGGTPAIYAGWADALDPDIRAVAMQPRRPGPDQPMTLRDSAAALAHELVPQTEKPYAFFGNSLGAIIAFETIRVLIGEGHQPPVRLFACGSAVPAAEAAAGRNLRSLPDAGFLSEVGRLGELPREVTEDQELQQEFLPGLRGDYSLAETYEYISGPPLPCPISVFRGLYDHLVDPGKLQLWGEYTSRQVTIRDVPGNHFLTQTAATFLHRAIRKDLQQDLAAVSISADPGPTGQRA